MQSNPTGARAARASWSSESRRTACDVQLGDDHWMADVHDSDSGHPTPHDMLDAALAACTVLTLQLYLKHKGWPVGRIGADVTHEQVEGTYCLEVHVSVEGDLTAEQRTAVLRVVQSCPVHRTLYGDIAINASLA